MGIHLSVVRLRAAEGYLLRHPRGRGGPEAADFEGPGEITQWEPEPAPIFLRKKLLTNDNLLATLKVKLLFYDNLF